jgi:hypothetical protein
MEKAFAYLIIVALATILISGCVSTGTMRGNITTGGVTAGVPAAPSPTCLIYAEVLGVEKKNTNFNEFALSQGRTDFDYYLIKVKVSNISTYSDCSSFCSSCDCPSCDNLIKSVEDQGIILQLQDYELNPLTEGQKIKAYVKYGGDEWFHGYFGTISNQ